MTPTTPNCDLFTRAVGHHQEGNSAQAEALCRQILDSHPEHAGALNLLAMLTHDRGEHGSAIDLFRRAIALNPHDATFHHNLGVAYQVTGQKTDAIASFQQALRIRPDHAEALYNLGVLFRQEGRLREAIDLSQAAIRACPNHADAHLNLGLLHGKLEELERAANAFRRAVEIRPDLALARKNLLVALGKLETQHRGAGRWAAAQACLDEAIRLQPSPHLHFAAATLLPAIYSSVAEIDLWRGRLQDNLRSLQEQGFNLELTSEAPTLFYLAYQGHNDREILRDATRLLSAPTIVPRPGLPRPPGSRIRIGFISRFFRDHTIAQLFGGLIASLSRDSFTVTLLSIGKHFDPVAQTLRTQADVFVEVSDTNLNDARRQIAEEDLDVLFFTDIGMEPISYALAFSRFAPVQCATWGHPVTTGIETIDYFVSSQLLEIAEADEHYSERLIRLKTLPVYYHRPTLPVPPLGREHFNLPATGNIYGCPQSLFKLHPEFDEPLGEILRRDKQGTLVLLQGMHRSWDEIVWQRFATTIPDVIDRVRILPVLSRDDFLRLLNCCDVLLDPLHFGGGNTSYQALAFGVPIVTLPSLYLRGRITQALYRQMNVLDCVVSDKHEYVEKAVQLACDRAYRETVRRKIMAANHVLYENPTGVRELEDSLKGAVTRVRAATSNRTAGRAASTDGFAQALHSHQTGDRAQADAICRRILGANPNNADALNLLGMLAHETGQNSLAVDYLQRAVAANPSDGMMHYNLGVSYQVLERTAESIASYQEALRLTPDHADSHYNLARALLKQGNRDDARKCFENAIGLRPEFADALHGLGNLLRDDQKPGQALDYLRRAAQLAADRPGFHSDLANLLTQQGLPEEALAHYQETIRFQPTEAAHHSNLANVLVLLGRPDEAEVSCREALRLKPDFANALHNLAITRSLQGHLDEAIAINTEALRLEPGHAGAHNCDALWALQKGDFEHGWREYKWRWDIPNAVRREFVQPLWDGSRLEGKTILLHAEQGLGDTLQFIRYAPLVKERGGTVIAEAQNKRLVEILRSCPGVDQVVAQGTELPNFDMHSPLLELPRILQTTLATLPTKVPYLFAEPHLIRYWEQELGQGDALKIGIAWQGNARFPGDRLRSIPLRQFAPIARCDGVRLVSLQHAEGRGQLAAVRDDFHVNDLAGRLDASAAFVDTAAVMMNLDLVISSDTAICHLAGALGVPVWVALSVGADWRWLEQRDDCPWYPTMRLFRQRRLHDWQDVFERMAAALPERGRVPSPLAVANLWRQALQHFHARRFPEAEQACVQVLTTEPCHADAVNLQGMLRHQAGDHDSACERLRLAIHLSPPNAQFHYNLGVALHVASKLDDADASYRTAIVRQRDHADAHHNRAMILRQRGKLDDAVSEFRSAIAARPDHAEAHHNLGVAMIALGQLDEAVRHFRSAIAARPDHAEAHHNLGLGLVGLGHFDEAMAAFDQVLASNADAAETRFCRSLILLLNGDFAAGWTEYEWRWQSRSVSRRSHQQPLWDGSPFAGKTILLHAEQGLGDTLQFIRYSPLVKQLGGTVVVECQAALAPLLSRCPGIDHLVAVGDRLPPIDVQAPLLSLPRIFRAELSTLPATVPYVHADAKLVEHWREKLRTLSGPHDDGPGSSFKVGVAWQGDASFFWDRWRSIPLTSFGRLARIPGVQLIGLQVGDGREQLTALENRFPLVDLGEQLDQQSGAFVDTAAVMKNLDLVIASDSAVVHLAGALGVPVWAPLSYSPDWRWLLGREDSPWYPTMRLFRQARLGDWEEVFERIAAGLQEKVASAAKAEMIGRLLHSATENMQKGRTEDAVRNCDEILAVAPNHPDGLNLRGVLAHQAGRTAESAQFLRRAVNARPSDATFRYNLAVAEHVQGKLDAAIDCYRESLRLRPDHADACNNLGFALAEKDRPDEALAYYERALRLRPDYAEARSNIGLALATLGKLDEAMQNCDRALRIAPDNADARLARATLMLLQGDYERGWEEYEWRWKSGPMASRGIGPGVPSITPPTYSQPLWDGTPLDGRTILLYAEQGLGDTLQFIRYAPLVKERGGTVVVECQSRLERLLGRCRGIDSLIPCGSPLPPFDVRAPLLSLPMILRTTLAKLPAEVPYVFADPGLVESWKRVLVALSGYKIGIVWSGDRRHDWGGRRCVALKHMAPIAAIPGVRLVSLQKGEAADEVRGLSGAFDVTDFAGSLDETAGPFMDTAALMKSLDLIITVDTSLAHLAGALGVPVWIALPFVPDWRWLMGRDDSPWYPTARLFRQTRPGKWDDVFQRIAADLASQSRLSRS